MFWLQSSEKLQEEKPSRFDFTPRCERVCSAPQGSTTFHSMEADELPNPVLAVWVGSGDSVGRRQRRQRTQSARRHRVVAAPDSWEVMKVWRAAG